MSMQTESRAYFKALGAHVTILRKSRGMTQAELSRAIGVSQQAVFAYENGQRRISVLVLAKLAKVFSTSVEGMVGLSKPLHVPKGRLSPRCVRHAERLQALSKTQQRFLIRIIDVLEDSNCRRAKALSNRPH
jgi:transcriptional regulator with XRE-family HTH domain